MPINITMPAVSPATEKGTLAKWHFKQGDSVASGAAIAEIGCVKGDGDHGGGCDHHQEVRN